MNVMNREETLELLRRHVKTEMLMKHRYSVEAVIPIEAIKHPNQASSGR